MLVSCLSIVKLKKIVAFRLRIGINFLRYFGEYVVGGVILLFSADSLAIWGRLQKDI